MRRLKRSAIGASLVGVAIAGAFALLPTRTVHTTVTPAAGTGEHLLLVIADVVTPANARARLAEVNGRFGDLQGFYADGSDAYEITGALVRTSPDEKRVQCSDHPEYECPHRATSVSVQRDVEHRFVGRGSFREHRFTRDCGRSGRPPCERERFVQLFGADLRMPRGSTVIATAFRTPKGAAQFVAFARTVGVRGLVTVQVSKSGGGEVGLGQESHPDGSGPLTRELPDQAKRQRS
ncbi:MAG: hypothetical protein WD826_12550 [Actinomycetota bacterium]